MVVYEFNEEQKYSCVRWYLSFKLSSPDLVQMMSERGIRLAHTTILRWVQRYVPDFEKRWREYARPVDGSWRCDETYIKGEGPVDVFIELLISRAAPSISYCVSGEMLRRRNASFATQ